MFNGITNIKVIFVSLARLKDLVELRIFGYTSLSKTSIN